MENRLLPVILIAALIDASCVRDHGVGHPSRSAEIDQILLQAAGEPNPAKSEADIQRIVAIGNETRPSLLKALYGSDVKVRRVAAVALAEQPDKFKGLDVCDYEKQFPASKNFLTSWILGTVASQKDAESRSIFQKCIASNKPDAEAVGRFDYADSEGVAALIRAGKVPEATLEVIRQDVAHNPLPVLAAAMEKIKPRQGTR